MPDKMSFVQRNNLPGVTFKYGNSSSRWIGNP